MTSVAVIPGDDAAAEAVSATVAVLRDLGSDVDWQVVDDPSEEAVQAAVDRTTTALFGATSGRTGGLHYLRWGRQTYASVRPVRWRPGFASPLRHPQGVDYVIVRENLEDLYVRREGDLPEGGGRYATKVVTREGTARAARTAARIASHRRGDLVVAAKCNVLPGSDGFFCDVAEQVAAEEFPGVAVRRVLIDNLAGLLVERPQALDVVLLPNLYGDLLSSVAAATIGGTGVAPSGCYGDDYAYFEPVHGSAPDIAGTHTINPTATLLAAVMLLEHIGRETEAARLEGAIDGVYAAGGPLTPDQGGTATTEEMAAAVAARL